MECVQEAIQENQEQGKLKIAKFEEKHLLVGPVPLPTSRCRCSPARGPAPPWSLSLFTSSPTQASTCPTHCSSSTIPGSRWGLHDFLPRWFHYPGGDNKEDDHCT